MAINASAAASSIDDMGSYDESDRVTALAGVFQGAWLAHEVARTGRLDASAFASSRESLFAFDPGSVAAVFGDVRGVRAGLRALAEQLDRPARGNIELSRYVIAIVYLADRLRRDAAAMRALRDDLDALARRRSHFELGDGVQNEQLATTYQERISGLGPRIMVRGEPLHLRNPENAARIRVALLAGVRAAVLWRQAGGKKWQLLLRRRAIARVARDLVDTNRD